jgi:hypothetical protein
MDTNLILANDQAAINAIRAVGAKQLYVRMFLFNLKKTLGTNYALVSSLRGMAIQVVILGRKTIQGTLQLPAL